MFYPKKSLGQNFLSNPRILDKIVNAAEIKKDDIIVEVGPGTGNLTKLLSHKAGRIIAIEKDRRIIDELRSIFSNSNVEIFEGDALKFNPKDMGLRTGSYKIVANIPYYITSNFIRQALEIWPRPKLIVLTIQKEVSQRIIAKPPHMNLLALSVQYYAEPKIISYISKGNFYPAPKVDSAIIKLITREKQLTTDSEKLFKIIKAGFASKRKQLSGNLSKHLKISKERVLEIFNVLNLKETVRAENLNLDDWIKIADSL